MFRCIAQVEGNLLKVEVVRPDKGRGDVHQSLHLLQMEGKEPNIIKLKDYDLNRKHKPGQFKALCTINYYSMDGNTGVSAKIFSDLQKPVNKADLA